MGCDHALLSSNPSSSIAVSLLVTSVCKLPPSGTYACQLSNVHGVLARPHASVLDHDWQQSTLVVGGKKKEKEITEHANPEGERHQGRAYTGLFRRSGSKRGDGHAGSSLRRMVGVCSTVVQDKPPDSECEKLFSPGQAMRCRCWAGVRTCAMKFPLIQTGTHVSVYLAG